MKISLAQKRSWLARRPVTAEVAGSSPVWVAKYLYLAHEKREKYWLGSSVGTSARLKIVRSTVRSCPEPLLIHIRYFGIIFDENFALTSHQWSAQDIDATIICGYIVATAKGDQMAADAVVRARVSESTKREAAVILEKAGLTTSDLIRMVLIRVVEDKALPFDPVRPNKVTSAAINAARDGKVKSAKSAKALMKTLNAKA